MFYGEVGDGIEVGTNVQTVANRARSVDNGSVQGGVMLYIPIDPKKLLALLRGERARVVEALREAAKSQK